MSDAVFDESSQFASEAIGAFWTVTSLTLESFICNCFERLCHGHMLAAYKEARWVSIILGFSKAPIWAARRLSFTTAAAFLPKVSLVTWRSLFA